LNTKFPLLAEHKITTGVVAMKNNISLNVGYLLRQIAAICKRSTV